MAHNSDVILVIGNGFDLNLGLKTGYSDFIKSEHFRNQIWKNELFTHLHNCHELEKWIDIENELKKYSKRNPTENFETNFAKLCECLRIYLEDIDYDSMNPAALAFKLLDYIKDTNFLIIDFNYTDTVEVIFKELSLDYDSLKTRHIKIHGSVKKNDIIFGVEDRASIEVEHIFLKKSFNPNFKQINFNKLLEESNQVIFFGHSLGETDHMYFDDFFRHVSSMHNHPKDIVLFFHGNQGYKQLFIQLDELTSNQLSKFKQNNKFIAKDTSLESTLLDDLDIRTSYAPGIIFSN